MQECIKKMAINNKFLIYAVGPSCSQNWVIRPRYKILKAYMITVDAKVEVNWIIVFQNGNSGWQAA